MDKRLQASLAGYKVRENGKPATVVIDTYKVVLLPSDMYEEGVEVDYLRFNGLEPSHSETPVVSCPAGGITAVMAVESDIVESARKEFGEDVCFSSPLLEMAKSGRRDVNIFLTAGNAYLAVWERGLRMAAALPDPSDDSLLYYLQVIGRSFKLKKFNINIDGTGAGPVASILGQYHKNVRTKELCG